MLNLQFKRKKCDSPRLPAVLVTRPMRNYFPALVRARVRESLQLAGSTLPEQWSSLQHRDQ